MPDKWPFAHPENLAVVTLHRILLGDSIVSFVTHDEDDHGWQFLDGAKATVEDGALVSLLSMVQLDPSLLELADLPIGWSASRSGRSDPWQRIDPAAGRDRKLLSDVEDYGWHVALIPEDAEGPAFAFSVGLYENFGHPEILIFGLGIETMHSIINLLGEEVRGGRRFAGSDTAAGIIEGFDLCFRSVAAEHYGEYLGTARWFYKDRDFPALQAIWPDEQGRFPWDNSYPDALRSRQPIMAAHPPG